jgi:hypothetical protein
MNYLTVMVIAAVVISGCASAPTPLPPLNMATGEDTALVRGDCKYFRLSGGGYEPNPRTASYFLTGRIGHITGGRAEHLVGAVVTEMRLGAGRKEIIVDAGPVTVVAACLHSNFWDGPGGTKARFDFTAEPGHTYAILNDDQYDCLKLLDVTADPRELACERQFRGHYVDRTTGDDSAGIIAALVLSSYLQHCWLLDESFNETTGFWGAIGYLGVDAGPTHIEVICEAGLPLSRIRKLSMDFVAEAGHAYTFWVPDRKTSKKCVSLRDITADEIVVTCEPFK